MAFHFLYSGNPLRASEVDPAFAEEVQAMRARGFSVSTCSDQVLAGEKPLRAIGIAGATIIYRGWMLSPTEYARLEAAVSAATGLMLTSTHTYLQAHHLPNWYQQLADLTPETRVFRVEDDLEARLRELAWPSFFVKDYVKSLKTGTGSVITHPDQIRSLVAEMVRLRGEIEGGICVRRVESFDVASERRYFVVGGVPRSPTEEPVPEIVHEVARRIKSPFYSVDVVRRTDGIARVVEVGDGQVSDLVCWAADSFAQMWDAHCCR